MLRFGTWKLYTVSRVGKNPHKSLLLMGWGIKNLYVMASHPAGSLSISIIVSSKSSNMILGRDILGVRAHGLFRLQHLLKEQRSCGL